MDLTPKARAKAFSSQLTLRSEADEDGVYTITGHVMAIAPADPIYGADEGTRVAFICDESPKAEGALVSVALSQCMMPELAAGQRVRVSGQPEPLTMELEDSLLEFVVLAALDIRPV